MSLARRRISRAAGAIPGGVDGFDPSTPSNDDSAVAPMIPRDDDPTTPYDAVDPANALLIPGDINPAISDAISSATSGYGD